MSNQAHAQITNIVSGFANNLGDDTNGYSMRTPICGMLAGLASQLSLGLLILQPESVTEGFRVAACSLAYAFGL